MFEEEENKNIETTGFKGIITFLFALAPTNI
jgi:hypothetical protein